MGSPLAGKRQSDWVFVFVIKAPSVVIELQLLNDVVTESVTVVFVFVWIWLHIGFCETINKISDQLCPQHKI